MNPQDAAALITADQERLKQTAHLTTTAKGQLRLGMAGNPLSVTNDQVIFALAMKVTDRHPIEEFVAACEELLAEGACDSYRIVTETDRHRQPDEPNRIVTALATPVVLIVRARSAISTGIGPAAE